MSRGYEVQWRTAQDVVRAGDETKISVDLLCVLGEDEMRATLRECLAKQGWTKNEDGTLTKSDKDVISTLDKDGKTVTVKVDRQRTVVVRGESDAQLQTALAKQQEAQAEALRKKVVADLLRVEEETRKEVDLAIQETYEEALMKKAASMGSVTSIQKISGANGEQEIVIKVEVAS